MEQREASHQPLRRHEGDGRRGLMAAALAVGALALLLSLRFPYWRMRIAAPQYPKGLHLIVYANRLEGDVQEIDMLNHYIGMRPLAQGARVERRLAIPGIVLAVACLLVAIALPRRWAILLALPALLLPLLFAGDLYWWMRDYGLNLNPKAPLSNAVKPFVPPLFGIGKIAQFQVAAGFREGFALLVAASVLTAIGLIVRGRGSRATGRGSAVLIAATLLIGAPDAASAQTLRVEPGHPHPTLQEALQAAEPGDVIRVRGGVHPGPVVIEKTLMLIGEGAPVIDGHGRGTVVTLAAPNIVFRGFIVRGSGDVLSAEHTGILVSGAEAVVEANVLEDVLFGISVRHAPRSVIRGNRLSGKVLPLPRRGDPIRVWYSDGTVIQDNTIVDGRDLVLWFSSGLTVRDNLVRRSRYGLHFMYCHDATVDGNRLEDNSVGIYLMYSARLRVRGNRMIHNRGPSGYGLGLKDMEDVLIDDNVLADNRAGMFLEHASGTYAGNAIVGNDIGVILWPSSRDNRFTANTFSENGEQVVIEGGGASPTNRWAGNYWSDYRGFDANQDGVGDVPHRATRLFERLADRYPALRFYRNSPAAGAIDFAARLVPLFAPQPTLVDEAPRMRPLGRAPG